MSINSNQEEVKNKNSVSMQNKSGANWNEVSRAKKEIANFFGFVPNFVDQVVDSAIPGAWSEAQSLRFGSHTALEPKLKGLIGLAVGAQIPCDRITYFEQSATLGDGATQQEQLEAVLMGAITRHWSTVLNGSLMEKGEFQKEADKIMDFVQKMMANLKGATPPQAMFQMSPSLSPEQVYKDMEAMLGCVPKFFQIFPKDGIAAAWSEFKGVQLSPFTSLSGKEKELIGLAVAAQIPCDYCIYFHKGAAKLNQATDREINEAIAVAAVTRHWSTIFNGPQMTLESFKTDADKMVQHKVQGQLQ